MSEQDELNDLIFGKEINAKRNAFNKAIEQLGQEYTDYFKSRKSKLESEEHDKIENHFTIQPWNNGGEVFVINNDSDIKDLIKKRLLDIYNRYTQ